jgi:hypothetical protein
MSVSGTLSIIVAAVAVILGFLILRDINDSGDASGGGGSPTETTATTLPGGPDNTADPTATTVPTVTTPVLKPYTVLVANAAKVNGAAKAMTDQLTAISVTTIEGVTATGIALPQSITIIYYLPDYAAEAQDLANKMGVAQVAAMPATPPVESLGTANVLVQLGTDKAGQPLAPTTAGTETTLAATTPPT